MASFTLASEYVTDTMGLILRIEKRTLSQRVKTIFDSAESRSTLVHIPAMVFAEVFYLSDKQRISASIKDVENHLKTFPNYREYPLNLAVVQSAAQITDVGELHDRLIAGTARLLNLDLVTNDAVLQGSAFVNTVW